MSYKIDCADLKLLGSRDFSLFLSRNSILQLTMSQLTEGFALLEQRGSQHRDLNSESMNAVTQERRRLKGKGKEIEIEGEELDASGNQGRDLDINHNRR